MTPNADDLIEILKKLVTQIESLDGNVKGLVQQSHELNKGVQLMEEYHGELGVLNNISELQPRTSLITALQDEERQIEQLEGENRELRLAIEQHQQVLQLIMAKYREQGAKLRRVNQLEARYRLPADHLDAQRHRYMAETVHQTVQVMDRACEVDEAKIRQQQLLIEKIREENGRIKRLLLQKKVNEEKRKTEEFPKKEVTLNQTEL
ncbi:FGFR1 oncoprotein partner 2 [Tyrophagus putrescentiae]|nr:FGFR1 oncoprotein partner 2 [Tyrophagus putrescentiae]